MGDNLRQSEIDRIIDNPSSQGDLYAGMSDDDSVESMVVSDIPDVSDSDDFIPGTDSESYIDANDVFEDSDSDLNATDSMNVSANNTASTNSAPNPMNTEEEWEMYEGKHKMFQFNQTPKFNFHCTNESKPIDFYEHYLTSEVIEMMVEETNRNANDVISKLRLSRKSRLKDWKNTNPEEMKKFIGLLIYMGLVSLPRISDYWSKNVLYGSSVARKVMSRNRFQLLLRFWHFNDNKNLDRDGRIGKVKPLLITLNDLFFSLKVAKQDLVIDETMVPFRGRLGFRQYIPGKAHKYGVKLFKLCDNSGYTYAVKIYMGKGTVLNTKDSSVATKVVEELMSNSLKKGHNLYVDNYYTSVELANVMLSNQTHLAGTLRKSRKGLPKNLLKQNLCKGEMVCSENDDGIVVTKWKDKREVLMLSTFHKPDYVMIPPKRVGGQPILKPSVIVDYNKAKIGIDLSDQMSSYSTAVRKTMRWFHKIGEELLLGTSVVNSWLAYNNNRNSTTYDQRKKNLVSITKFKEELAYSLMGLQEEPIIPRVTTTGHHYLTSSPLVGEGTRKRRVRKVCKMCYKKASEEKGRDVARNISKVTTFCSECPQKPFLCGACFKNIHK